MTPTGTKIGATRSIWQDIAIPASDILGIEQLPLGQLCKNDK
jgi:hypothetical protein